MIRMDGVHKRFANGTLAVRDMSVTIEPGQFVSFLGPSGCGKGVALRMIAGLLSSSAGSITVNGHPAGKGGDGSDVGFVFQEATLMPWATVFDNVYLPLRLAGLSQGKARPQVEEALSMVGLSNFTGSYPRELSGGMKMRVSIARAMVTRPTLLLMDEPFAALDEMTRFKLNNDVLKLWEDHNLTVIFVTHSILANDGGTPIDDCSTDRKKPNSGTDYQLTDANPSFGMIPRDSRLPAGYCPDVALLPLTADKTALKDTISNLKDLSYTGGQIGVAVGLLYDFTQLGRLHAGRVKAGQPQGPG